MKSLLIPCFMRSNSAELFTLDIRSTLGAWPDPLFSNDSQQPKALNVSDKF
jgi:hypothetical protein